MKMPVRQAAQQLGVTVSYLRRLIRRGRISADVITDAVVATGWYYEVDVEECRAKRIGSKQRRSQTVKDSP